MKRRLRHVTHGQSFRRSKHRMCADCDHCECHAVHGKDCPQPCPYPDEHHAFIQQFKRMRSKSNGE